MNLKKIVRYFVSIFFTIVAIILAVNVYVWIGTRFVSREENLITGRMSRIGVMQAANDRPFIHNLRAPRQQIDDFDSWDIGLGRPKRSTVFDRCSGFRIPSLVL